MVMMITIINRIKAIKQTANKAMEEILNGKDLNTWVFQKVRFPIFLPPKYFT